MRLVGKQLDWSEAKVSRVENAKQGITEADVSAMLAVLRVTGTDRERLLKMAREIDQPAWWELGHNLPAQLSALIDTEQRATHITDVTLNLLPGLLQTRAYTRAVMESAGVGSDQIDDLVSIRQVRQGALSSSDPATLHCFIDETALLRPVGGARVMSDQLRSILTATGQSNITVQVLPLALGAHAGLAGTFVLLKFIKSRPVVYLEARSSGAFLDEPDDVSLFADAAERLNQLASDPTASGEIIAKYMKQYESEAP